ncbi:MAG: DUF5103 domain-containing protein [Prevotellaceae bacterium]|jgi:hypothetical protein|nr:DUF5103 domain-containing protein [Prevotellaceae bacterium]
MKRYFAVLSIVTLVAGSVEAQSLQHINQNLAHHDGCYDNRMRSIKLYRSGNPISDPVITMNTSETVTLMFDEVNALGEPQRNYYYTVEHRDADWNYESLLSTDYITGFPENPVESVGSSTNTAVAFVAYSLILPNHNTSLKMSGNYMIKVYDKETRNLMFEKGFSVVEPLTDVYVSVKPPVSQFCMQQLDIKVGHQKIKVYDPYANLKMRVEQNSVRMKDIPVPAFAQPNLTDFSRPDRNMYHGLNEFRAFDTRNLSFNGQGVASIQLVQGTYRIGLVNDVLKEKDNYISFNDANGKYIVGADRAQNPATQSDYVEVNFSLSPVEHLIGRVFIFGELTNWSLMDEYEMTYRPDFGGYSCTSLLKQGYYNYRYVLLTYDGTIEIIPTEGCFYDTENAYNIYVYFRQPGMQYDRLIGFEKISTRGR